MMTYGITALVALLPTLLHENSVESFQAIERHLQAAQTPSDFALIAAEYESLNATAGPSVSLLFNQANAWCKAQEFGRAIAGYEQALKLNPRHSDSRNNLKFALAASGHHPENDSSIGDLFFWINRLSMNQLALLTTLLLLMNIVLYLAKGSFGHRKLLFRTVTAFTVILLISFSVKVLNERVTQHGVIVAKSCDVKKKPNEAGKSAFSKELTDGQRFTVSNDQEDWVQIHVKGVGTGWVPKNQVMTY